MRRPGSSWEFGPLLKGLTSVIDNSCRSRDFNPQPRVTSPMLYPLEPRLPNPPQLPNPPITASMRRGMEAISLWHCSGVMEAQVALIAAFGSSALFGLAYRIFLFTIPHRFSMGFRSGEFAGQSSTLTPWSLNQFWYLWQCGQVPSPAGKWNKHLHTACQQKEPWSALKFPGRWLRWLWTSENTVDQHQQMTWQPKSSLTV